tara:strand:+ start:2058 stop:2579 length:522 start_codon:yes stop_codon:yes gene_type:complete
MGKKRNGLTEKQERFADYLALGDPKTGKPLTATQSYALAYNTENMSRSAMRVEASRLSTDPNIALRVSTKRASLTRSRETAEINTRQKVLDTLHELLDHATGERGEQTRIAAARLLGETQGMYKSTVETTIRKSSDELLAELDELIDQAIPDESGASDDADFSGDATDRSTMH